jgi:hypothetical protein
VYEPQVEVLPKMRFNVEILEMEVPSLIGQMLKITGTEPWIKRFEWIVREVNENRHMADWLQERFSLEWTIGQAIKTGNWWGAGDGFSSFRRYELGAFCAATVNIYNALSQAGKVRLIGQLLGGLKTDQGLLSMQHEIATVVHLIQSGFDVELHDLESGGGFDFLAKKEGIEIEVECKMFSADIGRKIHRRSSAKLFKALESTLSSTFKSSSCGILIRITLPLRLSKSPHQHEEIRQALQLGLLSGGLHASNACSVAIQDFDVAGSPFAVSELAAINRQKVQTFVARLTGQRNSTMMILVTLGSRALVCVLESSDSDDVLSGIRRQLRDAAAKQFTGSRPSCLVAQLHDLSNDQMLSLATANSTFREGASELQVMTSDLLQTPTRAHVHSVVYRGRSGLAMSNQTNMGQGWTYVMKNAWHPLADDPRCSIFNQTKQASQLINT